MSGAWIYAGWAIAALLGAAVVNLSLLLLLKWRDADQWEDHCMQEVRRRTDAELRAAEAEAALTEIRMKRSLAVSKGNRRRAELERARILQTTEAVRVATARKKQPQGSLPL